MSQHDSEPWKMTAHEWNKRMCELKDIQVQAKFTRASPSQEIARMQSLTGMRFDVHGETTKRLRLAEQGQIKLSRQEVDDLLDHLARPVDHRMVVEKAMLEGYPVPENVLADYPDILQPAFEMTTA